MGGARNVWLARAGAVSAVTALGVAGATPASAQSQDNGQFEPLIGDISGDGVADRATLGGNATECTVAVELGDGAGGYLPADVYAYPNTSYTPNCPDMGVIVDLGGDGTSELVLAFFDGRYDDTDPSDLLVLRDYSPVDGFDAIWQPSRIGTADFNGDGLVDVYEWTDQGSGFISYLNTPSSELVPGPLRFSGRPFDYFIVDVDEDGADDLVMSYDTTDPSLPGTGVVVVLDDGTTSYLRAQGDDGEWWTVKIGDGNGDGHLDVETTDYDTGEVITFWGNGTGSFVAK